MHSSALQPPQRWLTGWQKPSASVGLAFWHLLEPQQSAELAQPYEVSAMH